MINSQPISTVLHHFPYVSYLQALLNYSDHAKGSILETALWAKDKEGYFDTMDLAGNTNEGFITRAAKMRKSRVIELACPLLVPLLCTSRPFPTETELFLRMHRAAPNFSIMVKDGDINPIKIYIKRAALRYARLYPYQSALKGLQHAMKSKPAVYPFIDYDCRPLFIAKNTQNVYREIFEGIFY